MALRLLKGVRELRFVLCQSSSHSETLRKYIASNYEAIRTSPARITVRECENSPPVAIATFSYGVEKTIDLRKLNASEINQALE
jgi:NADH dehydrogenase (ubiquinone) 1 alpha subcomplex subunit 2